MAPVSDTQAPKTTITLSTGEVAGAVEHGIRRFLGIPYAQPPFGARRFALPVPVEPWDEPRDATAFGPTAPQDPYSGAIGELLSSVEIPGEDILTVNVWAPAEAPAEGLPVMVWFHGGALERGTAALSIYDGTSFARDGVVFVSVNYRVGSEGFSVLEDAPRNLGLSDAALGLAWVAREIAAFGGDPARITIVGESAGGAIVAALLMRPDSAPLVAGAVIESGPLEAESPERAARVTRALAKAMGVPPTAEAFRALTPRQLLNARKAQSGRGTPLGGVGFTLALDRDSLPVSPHVGLADVAIPLVIGSNTDEYRLWFPPAALARIGRLQLLAGRVALRIPGRTIAEYRRAFPGASTGEVFGQVATDRLLRGPAVRTAQQRSSPTFVYEFAWPSPVRDLRAAHALEIGFVFDNGADPDSLRLAGADAPQSLADRMHGDWVAFIRSGDPGWPAYDERRLVQIFDTESRVEPLRRAAALDALPLPGGRAPNS
jgi:para-nitrobenzyl esterase